MTNLAVIDEREITITPLFKIMEIENIPKSETAGYPVMEAREMVEVRFAGAKNYSPCFPSDAFSHRDPANGNRLITFAERWPEQYRSFKQGNPQEAMGTPLDMLRQYGVSPEQLSLCRALRIYSIEALNHLEGQAVKSLGMNANKLKEAAAKFLAARDGASNALDKIAALEAEIAAMKASGAAVVPPVDSTPEQIEQAVKVANQAYETLTDAEIKDRIAALNDGKKPQGNPSRATLVGLLTELEAA